jgi:hypothetical protein
MIHPLRPSPDLLEATLRQTLADRPNWSKYRIQRLVYEEVRSAMLGQLQRQLDEMFSLQFPYLFRDIAKFLDQRPQL